MKAEFTIKACFNLPSVGVVVSGEVIDGQIKEGMQGKIPKGKNCMVVRIDSKGQKVFIAHRKDKVNLTMKNIIISDVRPGETIYFY